MSGDRPERGARHDGSCEHPAVTIRGPTPDGVVAPRAVVVVTSAIAGGASLNLNDGSRVAARACSSSLIMSSSSSALIRLRDDRPTPRTCPSSTVTALRPPARWPRCRSPGTRGHHVSGITLAS
jgi:hypothetical protein